MTTVFLDSWFFHSFVPLSRRNVNSLRQEVRHRRFALVRLGRTLLRLWREYNGYSEEERGERLRVAALIAALGNQQILQDRRRKQLERELKQRGLAP